MAWNAYIQSILLLIHISNSDSYQVFQCRKVHTHKMRPTIGLRPLQSCNQNVHIDLLLLNISLARNTKTNSIWPHCSMQFNSDKCFGRAFGRCRSTVQWSWRFRERNSIVHLYKVNRWLSGYCKVHTYLELHTSFI